MVGDAVVGDAVERTLGVDLQDSANAPARVYVRDGHGLVLVLPVREGAVADVRRHLENTTDEACDVELLDDQGRVLSRWGSFRRRGEAEALGVVLLGADRNLARARVVA